MAYSGEWSHRCAEMGPPPFSALFELLSPGAGLELSFYSGVYGTCLGATAQFGQAAKGLIGVSGMVLGVGEIIGGLGHEICSCKAMF